MISNPSAESIVIGTFAHLALPLMVMYNVLIQFVSRNVISNMHNRKSLNTLTRKIVNLTIHLFSFLQTLNCFVCICQLVSARRIFGHQHWKSEAHLAIDAKCHLSSSESSSPSPSYLYL